ncbi:MAG: hypothetical protein WAT77_12505 [Paracoccaceae bacterium]
MQQLPPTRKLTIIAKDPGLRLGGDDGPMAFAQVDLPAERLSWGPTGYRIKVVDYNATEQRLYLAEKVYEDRKGNLIDPFAPARGETLLDKAYQQRLLADPNFHAQNVYAIAMRTLGLFERALGRRVAWSSGGHQLHIAPHAFEQANAFYSEPDRALLLGYFHDLADKPVFTCLSHDIVAHETTHALLDGLRSRFTEPSGPDQAAFHEGFADVIALLSIFSLETVVAAAIGMDGQLLKNDQTISLVNGVKLSPGAIKSSILLGLAQETGTALGEGRRTALRRSVELTPREARVLRSGSDEHDRGEVFVAAMMTVFVQLWCNRIARLGTFGNDRYNLDSVVEEGAKVAQHLLNMSIRALDYCPPTDIDFGQYLAALLTADRELVPNDEHNYRRDLAKIFNEYGITSPTGACDADGCWPRYPHDGKLVYSRSNFASMMRSRDEFFRFLWENRGKDRLNISERAYTEVLSIASASRIGPDGIALEETICQYVQRVDLFGAEFKALLGAERPEGLRTTDRYTAYGGGVVILDQYGQVKFHVPNRLLDPDRQVARADYLIDTGQVGQVEQPDRLRFAMTHLARMGA